MNRELKPLSPFKGWVLENFPFIEADFDAITNYQLISKVVEYLNNIISNENEQNEAIIDLTNKFIELKNYIDNLDLQEYVNNKLDEMAESGQLDQIVEQYLSSNAVWGFDTVAEMKLATNLINGSYARTLGYSEKNDGGSALYKIRTITNDDVVDEMFIIELYDDTLVAELIVNNIFKPEQLGADNSGLSNTADIFQAIFNNLESNGKIICSGTYLIEKPLYLPNKNNILISGGTFKATNNFNGYIFNSNLTRVIGYSGWEYATENLTLENVFIDGSYSAAGIYLDKYLRVKIISCTLHNFKNYGIYLNDGHECTILSTNLIGRTYGDEDQENTGIYVNSHDNIIDSCVIAYCQWAMYINASTNQICNCHFYCNRLNGGNVKTHAAYLTFDNNYFDGSGIYAYNPWQLVFNNNIFNITANTNHIIKLDRDTTGIINIDSIYITNSVIFDTRSNSDSIDFIECTFTPTSVKNCYIDKINKPTNININNPSNIFSFKNNDNPVIIPETFFKATRIDNVIGTHSDTDNWYEFVFNGNYIKTNYIGSTSNYTWLYFKIYVPERMRIQRNMTEDSGIAFYTETEEYIGQNKATLEKGIYIVAVYRSVELYLSTN